MVPGHEVCVGRREGLGVPAQLVPSLLLDLLKDLAALVWVDQLLRAERGDRLALDFVRRQVKVLRFVADAAGPVRGPDDEQASELEQVDRLLAVVGGRVCLRSRRRLQGRGFRIRCVPLLSSSVLRRPIVVALLKSSGTPSVPPAALKVSPDSHSHPENGLRPDRGSACNPLLNGRRGTSRRIEQRRWYQ